MALNGNTLNEYRLNLINKSIEKTYTKTFNELKQAKQTNSIYCHKNHSFIVSNSIYKIDPDLYAFNFLQQNIGNYTGLLVYKDTKLLVYSNKIFNGSYSTFMY